MRTLYYNGNILTMEGCNCPQAVLTENGIIKAVGDYSQLSAVSQSAQPVDLQGRTMLPAFIDAHSHFSAYASSLLQVPLEECTSFEEISQRISQFIETNQIPKGQWVTAKGYDHNSLNENRHPDLALLDACSPDNPLILQHASGHVGVFNTKAMIELGITSETPSPIGGVIEIKNGALTGYMEEKAYFTYAQKAPMPDAGALLGAYMKAQDSYAAHGITTIQEGMAVSQMIPLYQALLSRDMLKLDVVAYADLKDAKEIFTAFPHSIKQYSGHFKLGGYKIFLDGSPQGRTAWMRTPYADDSSYFGYGTMTDEEVFAALSLAAEKNMQILAHCNGDGAAAQYLKAANTVNRKADISKLRPVIIHPQLLAKDQLPEVKRLGLIPSFFVAHVYHWGDVHIKNFGKDRASMISPAGSALELGILFTFHQDTPVIEPNMLETVWCAVNRITKLGVVLGDDQCISVYDALKAVTINAAYQYFEEDKKGSIAVGKNADFVILDSNPLAVEPMKIRNISVLETIKNDVSIYNRQPK